MKNDKVAPTPRTAGIALWTLTAVYTLSFLDRQIIAILAEEIKRDLELSDAEVGLITGFAFALFYATLGVPIARAADFRSRPKIIAVCLTIWSVMTAACGLAANFVQLALARIGVGVGEAGCMPPAHSLIAEMFPPEKRSGAMAIFQLGVPLGILLGFLIGGWVNEFFGWRYSLLVVGGPGAFLALWVLFAVPEPRASGTIRADGPPFLKTAAKLWKDPVYRHLVAGATFASMAGYAAISWTPAMLIRQYELGTGYVGTVLSIVIGVGGAVGLYWGGKVGDAASTRLSSGPYKVAAVACFVAAPAFGAAYLASSIMATILLLAGAFILAFAWMGPNWAMVQERAPGEGRAVAASIVLLFINLIGLGVGPPVVGALSDMLSSYGSSSGLRFALLVAPLAFALAGIHFTLGARAAQSNQGDARAHQTA